MNGLDPADDPSAGMDIAADFVEEDVPEVPQGDRLERLSKLAEALTLAQFEIGKAEDALEEKIKLERKLREEDIPNLMKQVRMKEITLTDGVKLKDEDEFKCNVSKDRKPLAFAWLRDHGLGAVIKRIVGVAFGKGEDDKAKSLHEQLEKDGFTVDDNADVHPATLHATLANERELGHAIPQDIFGLFEYQTTKLEYPRGRAKPPKPRFTKKK